MPDVVLRSTTPSDIDTLMPLVAAYHAFEGIDLAEETRQETVSRLLSNPTLGRIWFIDQGNGPIGYIAVCYGYSIEFGGRDAFVDELFLVPEARGQGIGGWVLEQVKRALPADSIVALHLEVDRGNTRAQRLYSRAGFELRSKYQLMSVLLDRA